MADLVGPNGIPGTQARTTAQIAEIVRGVAIRHIRTETTVDPHHGGECLMIELQGGDKLIVVAIPNSPLALDGLTARLQLLLVTRRGTRLRGE